MMADGRAWGLRTIREHLTVTCVAYCAPWWVTTVCSTNWDRIFVAASDAGVDWPIFANHLANMAGRMLVAALGGQVQAAELAEAFASAAVVVRARSGTAL
jgi:hypothetical protein